MATHSDDNCILQLQDHQVTVYRGDIPSFKLVDTPTTYAFLDIGPLAKGHSLVIPKYHGAKLTDIPDEHLGEIVKHCKAIANAGGFENYNILQNNGKLAHQEVFHVHFHVIPKPNEKEGLGVGWPQQKADMDELKKYCEEM
ncbi:Adenosine 5'-monophosphoramidase [Cystobasidiomycetes sp. EMM_F5]